MMIDPANRGQFSLERQAREVLYEVLHEKQRIIKQLSTQLVDFTSELTSVVGKCEKMEKVVERMEGNLVIEDLVAGGFVNQEDGVSYVLVDLSQLIRQKVASIKIDPKAKIIKEVGRDEEKVNAEIEGLYNNLKTQYEKITKEMQEKINEYEAVIGSLKSEIKSNQQDHAGKIAELQQKIQILQDSNEMFQVQMQQLQKQKNYLRIQVNKRQKTPQNAQTPQLHQLQQLQKRVATMQRQISLINNKNTELSAANIRYEKSIQSLQQQKQKLENQCQMLRKQVDNIRRISFQEQSKVMQFFPGNKFIIDEPHHQSIPQSDTKGNDINLQQQNIELLNYLQKVKIENNQLYNENSRLKQQRRNHQASVSIKDNESNQQLSQTALFMADLMEKIKNLSNKSELILRCNQPQGSQITFDLSKIISVALIPKIPLRDPQQFHQSLHTSPLPQKDTSFPYANTNSKTAQKQQIKLKHKQKGRPKKYIRLGY